MAHSVAKGEPTFSANHLIEMFGAGKYAPIILSKKSDKQLSSTLQLLTEFSNQYLGKYSRVEKICGLKDYVESSPWRNDLRGLIGGFLNEDSGEYT
jgi:hypothetical protein